MTLKEYMEGHSLTQKIMVGARTGYFFGGSVLRAEKEIPRIYEAHIRRCEYGLSDNKALRKRSLDYLKKHSSNETITIDKSYSLSLVEDEEYKTETNHTLRWLEELVTYYKTVRDLINSSMAVTKYTKEISLPDYFNREIIEINKSIRDENIDLIVLDGIQEGKFWDMDEAERERKKIQIGG